MSTERWLRLDRLFVDALQRSPERRHAFVGEQCAGDEALRAEVLSLLAATEGSGDFMSSSAFERLADTVGAEGWTLAPGEQVGAYTVSQRLGAGSSGEVWRARDDRFGRDVAIKILLPHISDDPVALRRFADEVRAVGSLNHPNIVAVYDVGNHQGLPYLVSECLVGQNLRARLEAGSMAPADVAAIAVGMARALAVAHRRGIVHRDLKPENMFITDDGTVKILDFGVAKLLRRNDSVGETSATIAGFIAGTAAYMAPEQVRGEPVDARADLFAVGAILYELLAGAAPFKRGNTVETLHAVLTVDPSDIAEANRLVPTELGEIIMRLLNKSRDGRFQSATDLVWALEHVSRARTGTIPRDAGAIHAPVVARSWRGLALWLVAAAAGVLVIASTFRLAPNPSVQDPIAVTRFTWSLPAGVGLVSAPVVSPDGRAVAFIGVRDRIHRLFVHTLDAFDAREIDGASAARLPFWSPDSQWVGFFQRRRVMKVSIAGGAPITIADDSRAATVRTERGGAWGADDLIVYGPSFNPPSLYQVRASGGTPAPTTRLAVEHGQNAHRFPTFLPDGKHFLYLALGRAEYGLFVGGIGGETTTTPLIEVESNAVSVPGIGTDPAVLLYANHGRLTAQRFDHERRRLVGAPQPLSIDVGEDTLFSSAGFGASPHVLAYSGQLPYGAQIKTVDAHGGDPAVVLERQEQQWPRISPDGSRLAWLLIDKRQGADIWVEDLARRTRTRVTTAPERDLTHVWSPDGRQLAYRPDVEDRQRLTVIAADGSGTSRDVKCPRASCEPTDWSSDGRELIVNAYEAAQADVWAVAVADGGRTQPLLESRFNERDARLSPNRQWIAYVSDESGTPQVSVRSLVGAPRRYTVSAEGGDQVVWSRDGGALYYVNSSGRLQKVAVRQTNNGLLFGSPAESGVTIGSGHSNTQYDIAPDGRIYYLDPTPMSAPTEVRFVLGWQALLQK